MFALIALSTVGMALWIAAYAVFIWILHEGDRARRLWTRLEHGHLPAPAEVEAAGRSGMQRLAAVYTQAVPRAHRPLGLAETLERVDRCLAQIAALLGDWRLRLLLPGGDDFCAVAAEPTFLAARRPSSLGLRLLALVERLWRRGAPYVVGLNCRLRWAEHERAWLLYPPSARNAAWHIHVTTLNWAVRLARWALWSVRFARPERLPRRLASVYDEVGLLLHECCDAYEALWHSYTGWRGALGRPAGA